VRREKTYPKIGKNMVSDAMPIQVEAKHPYSKIRGKHPMSIRVRNLGEL